MAVDDFNRYSPENGPHPGGLFSMRSVCATIGSVQMIGRTLAGYEILSEIGRGGMGVVYKAKDLDLDRLVALKFLPAEVPAGGNEEKLLLREARAAAALNHPNICSVYGIEEADGLRFIVMEFVDGATLGAKVSGAALPVQEALLYAVDIGEALREAHGAGIVHRDIKPENVMIDGRGRVRVMDFGLAKRSGGAALTRSGTTVGTVAYMSPEQIRGEDADQQSDIFSYGLLLYEMLTGRRPFRGEHDAALLYSIAHEEPIPPGSINPAVPATVESVVLRALEKDRAQRYQSFYDLLADLRPALSGAPAPTEAAASPAFGGGVPSTRKRRMWAFLTAGALLAGIAAAFFFLRNHSVGEGEMTPRAGRGHSVDQLPRVIVLPLENISPDPQDEYIAAGLAEEISSTLSRIQGLRVVARGSARRLKAIDLTSEDVRRKLRVSHAIDGSVRKSGRQLRVSIRLIDVETEEQIWAEDYDREFKDIFQIQTDIADHVAAELKIQLGSGEREKLARAGTTNLEAYNLVLQARYHWQKGTEPSLLKTIDLGQQALVLDPDFAAAYSTIAGAYIFLGLNGYRSPDEVMREISEYANRGLAVGSSSAMVYTPLAVYKLLFERDWTAARLLMDQGMKIDPAYGLLINLYGTYYITQNLPADAEVAVRRALQLDPLSVLINSSLGMVLYNSRQYDRAIAQLRTVQELDAHNPRAAALLSAIYCETGVPDSALGELNRIRSVIGSTPELLAEYGYAFARKGLADSARAALNQLLEMRDRHYLDGTLIAVVYIGLNDRNSALEWLERAEKDRSPGVLWLQVGPRYDGLRNDPRYAGLVRKIGFPLSH